MLKRMNSFHFKVLFALVCAGLVAYAVYLIRRSPCVSREPGFRGEVMRQDSGKFVYFTGKCWTTHPMPPTDTPF